MIINFGKMAYFKDLRLGLTTDIYSGIKSIKYLSWEEIFDKKINFLRNLEFKSLSIIKGSDGILGIFWGVFSYVVLFITIIVYM